MAGYSPRSTFLGGGGGSLFLTCVTPLARERKTKSLSEMHIHGKPGLCMKAASVRPANGPRFSYVMDLARALSAAILANAMLPFGVYRSSPKFAGGYGPEFKKQNSRKSPLLLDPLCNGSPRVGGARCQRQTVRLSDVVGSAIPEA